MKIKSEDFRVREGKKVRLKSRPTVVKPAYNSTENYQEILGDHVKRLSDAQNLHYAANAGALLLIFQGMDGSGKDGTIRHVMSGVNPQGCQVVSFKHPSKEELEHDFLWRSARDLPGRGKIGIFNRSYYEEVLITRVHPEILKAEGRPTNLHKKRSKPEFWTRRFQSINSFEEHLHENGTKILKFFLHLSFTEQAHRFLARIDDPHKNWKLTADDIKEREYWDDYVLAYEECLSATSSEKSPWYIVPADEKLNARLIVSQIILDNFRDFELKPPPTDAMRRRELKEIRKDLEASLNSTDR